MVLDQLAVTTGEDGRPVGETCTVLLAAIGGKASDGAAVWQYGAADHGAAADWEGRLASK